jgi:hypothetical protein
MRQALEDWRNHHRVKAVQGFVKRHWNVIAFTAQFAAFAVAVVYFASVASNNQEALCAFRNDLALRVQQGTQFLEEHPEGFAGIPASTIQTNLENQKRTVGVFDDSGLDCDSLVSLTVE